MKVKTKAAICNRIARMNQVKPTHLYLLDGNLRHVKSSQIARRLQTVAKAIGGKTLGLNPNKIGTHSLRCSLALMLHLSGKSDSYIKLHGRWLSLAFMVYIKRQIAQTDDDTFKRITNSSILNFIQIN